MQCKRTAVVISSTLETKQKERKREQRVPSQYIRVTFPARASRLLPLNLAILKEKVVAQIFLSFFVPSFREGATGIASELLRGNQKRVNKKEAKETAIFLARREE
jgi:hypothetical protein